MEANGNEGVGGADAVRADASRGQHHRSFGTLIVLLGLAILAQNYLQTESLRTEIDNHQRKEQATVQTLESEWTSGGIKRRIVTTRKEAETDAEFIERHAAAESAALRQWPKDT